MIDPYEIAEGAVGYDLHITRRRSWADSDNPITEQEWLAFVQQDPELHLDPKYSPNYALWTGKSDPEPHWLDWSSGCIYSKFPDPALIDKMVAIARHFGATVQGDDGEIYESGSKPPGQPRLSLADRISYWFQRVSAPRRPAAMFAALPFRSGDRVLDASRCEATILEVDRAAHHGQGLIRVRYDDGRVVTYGADAHGLTLLAKGDHGG